MDAEQRGISTSDDATREEEKEVVDSDGGSASRSSQVCVTDVENRCKGYLS